MKTAELFTLLLLSVVTVTVVSSQDSAQYPVCSIQCCEVFPNCTSAGYLRCDCDSQDEVTLRKDDIPPSVQKMDISGASRVVIQKDAIFDLLSLRYLRFENIGSMEIQPDGLRMHAATGLFALNVQNVNTMEMQSSALSGSWNHDVKIRMQKIGKLQIRPGAFLYNSTTNRPSLSLEQITTMNLASHGFSAPFSKITILDARMATCEANSFINGNGDIDLQRLTIDEAQAGCVNVTDATKSLSFRSCKLDIVQPLAFTGHMHHLVIEDSNLTTVYEKGFKAEVNELQITGSEFCHLKSISMDVLSKHSIYLTRVMVKILEKNALASLEIKSDRKDDVFSIHKFHIVKAEDESLRLSKRINLRLYDLNVDPPTPPKCPIARWARDLTGQNEREQLSRNGDMVFKQLNRQKVCRDRQNKTVREASTVTHEQNENTKRKEQDNTSKHPEVEFSSVKRSKDVKITEDANMLGSSLLSEVVKQAGNSKRSAATESSVIAESVAAVKILPEISDHASVKNQNIILYCLLGAVLGLMAFVSALLLWRWNNHKSDHVSPQSQAAGAPSDINGVPEPNHRASDEQCAIPLVDNHLYEEIPGDHDEHTQDECLIAVSDSIPQLRHRNVQGDSDQSKESRSNHLTVNKKTVEPKSIDEIFDSF